MRRLSKGTRPRNFVGPPVALQDMTELVDKLVKQVLQAISLSLAVPAHHLACRSVCILNMRRINIRRQRIYKQKLAKGSV